MKNKTAFIISAPAMLGVCLILIIACKKESNNNPNAAEPLNIASVYIPGGTFLMGSSTDEVNHMPDETQHPVTLSSFHMSIYEITNAQFAAFLNASGIGSNGSRDGGTPLIYASNGYCDWGLHYNGEKWVPVAGFENHPVVFVPEQGAREFAGYAGGRLPTEAEWEYACRANTASPFNTGGCLTDAQANYNWSYPYYFCSNTSSNFPGKTQAAGTYPPNSFGLYDMHGNVAELCSDWYGVYPATAQVDPPGPATGSRRVVRGGSWCTAARDCRSAMRSGFVTPDQFVGFRIVLLP